MSPRRPPPQTAFEYVERTWRPATGWVLVLTFALPVGVCLGAILFSVAFAFVKAALTDQPVQDLTGGLDRILAPLAPYVGPVITGGFAALAAMFGWRSREVREEIRSGGGQDHRPFEEPSPASSEQTWQPGQGVNPHGGPNAP